MTANFGLATKVRGTGRLGAPTLVLMHFLGGSTREWDEVRAQFGNDVRTIAVDMPGFGDSADVTGYTVTEMADSVCAVIAQHHLENYILVGHSMSGKVAAVVARRLEGTQSGLRGMVLIAPSPPSPEPMDDGKRGMMIGMLGTHGANDEAQARKYITKNEQRDIPPAVVTRAAHEVLKMNRTAWVAWVERGSREDWSERVGLLHLPVLVVAGEKDTSLGPDQQTRLTLPHFANGRMITVLDCSHLVPMERPEELTTILLDFIEELSVQRFSVQQVTLQQPGLGRMEA